MPRTAAPAGLPPCAYESTSSDIAIDLFDRMLDLARSGKWSDAINTQKELVRAGWLVNPCPGRSTVGVGDAAGRAFKRLVAAVRDGREADAMAARRALAASGWLATPREVGHGR